MTLQANPNNKMQTKGIRPNFFHLFISNKNGKNVHDIILISLEQRTHQASIDSLMYRR